MLSSQNETTEQITNLELQRFRLGDNESVRISYFIHYNIIYRYFLINYIIKRRFQVYFHNFMHAQK